MVNWWFFTKSCEKYPPSKLEQAMWSILGVIIVLPVAIFLIVLLWLLWWPLGAIVTGCVAYAGLSLLEAWL